MENYFAELFERDLLKLRDEIRNFKDEDNIWRREDGVSNSAGTLVVHLVGSLSYSVGALIGNTGYVRDRPKEFSTTDVPQAELVSAIEAIAETVKKSLTDLPQSKLDEEYPMDKFGQKSVSFYLMHFYGHLNYHLGQINYLRRILEG